MSLQTVEADVANFKAKALAAETSAVAKVKLLAAKHPYVLGAAAAGVGFIIGFFA